MFSGSKIIIPDSIKKGGIAKTLPDPHPLNINPSAVNSKQAHKPKKEVVSDKSSKTQVQKKVILPLKGGISKTIY